jgi:hypothetical protein
MFQSNKKASTVKPLYYVHLRDPKISLNLLTRSLYLTWFVLNNEVHQYRKGPKFSVLTSEVYLLKSGPIKEVLLYIGSCQWNVNVIMVTLFCVIYYQGVLEDKSLTICY